MKPETCPPAGGVEYLVGRAAKRAGKKIRQVKQTTIDLFKAYFKRALGAPSASTV
jgi:hypothetical protein